MRLNENLVTKYKKGYIAINFPNAKRSTEDAILVLRALREITNRPDSSGMFEFYHRDFMQFDTEYNRNQIKKDGIEIVEIDEFIVRDLQAGDLVECSNDGEKWTSPAVYIGLNPFAELAVWDRHVVVFKDKPANIESVRYIREYVFEPEPVTEEMSIEEAEKLLGVKIAR